jgi:hypothetical protein
MGTWRSREISRSRCLTRSIPCRRGAGGGDNNELLLGYGTVTTMFTPSQQVALAVIPKFTGFLSILGSSWIIVEVLTQQTKRENVYNRLLCAMSIVDVTVSIWFFASSWPISEGTEGVAWTVGSGRTCVIQGFFIQMGATPPICKFGVFFFVFVFCNESVYRLTFSNDAI